MGDSVFVFGSNLAGRHGKGAALYARKHKGAIYGQGFGRQGMSFAIPTKDHKLSTLPITTIKEYVNTFLMYAKDHQDTVFELTPIGCGLAGYRKEEILPLFASTPGNVLYSKYWFFDYKEVRDY